LIAILFQLLGPHFRWMMIKTLNNALFKKNSDLFYIFEWSGLTGVFGSFLMVLFNIRMLEKFKIPMYITFVAYWVIGFPISYYLGEYTNLKAVGVWIGLLAGLTAAALFLFIRFHYLTKKLIKENH